MGEGRSLGVIRLANVAPFAIGPLRVEPATRQIALGARIETLEPRVMQVLVALSEARQAVVPRDQLIARCWDGRGVGDNAIHRVMSRLRDLAADLGADVFRIETIAKVGYRLVLERSEDAPSAAPKVVGERLRRIASAVLGVMIVFALGAALATGVALRSRSPSRGPATVTVTGDGGRDGEALARGVGFDLASLAAQRGNDLAVIDDGRSSPDYRVRVSYTPGGRPRADMELRAPGMPEALWSDSLEAAGDGAPDLRARASARVGAVLLCAGRPTAAEPRPPVATLRLFYAACERLSDSPDDEAATLLRQVVGGEPRLARAWGLLAVTEAMAVEWRAANASDAQDRRDRATEAMRRAEALDPASPDAILAEALLSPSNRWRVRLAILQRGIQAYPAYAGFYGVRSDLFFKTGRVLDAIADARRAVTLDAFSPRRRADLITTLSYAGHVGEARQELAAAQRIWPGSASLKDASFRIELRYGDPAALHAAVAKVDPKLPFDIGWSGDSTVALLVARAVPTRENIARAAAAADESKPNPMPAEWRIQVLGQFAQVDELYRHLTTPAALENISWATDIFFRAYMRPAVRDRRFMALAARLGLVEFWRDTGVWPDFCGDPTLTYSCKAEADRLGGT